MNTAAQELLAAWDAGRRMALPSEQAITDGRTFDLAQAWQVAEAIRAARIARGEQPRGYKIGFTNRTIWDRYRVHAPIWGCVWDSTLCLLDGVEATTSLDGLVQPRIEPEIVFGFARTPVPGSGLEALAACLSWVAHGFEIVHTHFEGWRFTAADTVADFGLHGRLLVGPRVPLAGWADPAADLSALELELLCDGVVTDRGRGSFVLDGPLHALHLWIESMAAHTPHWPIRAGDVVTTGTLTDAWPLEPGQVWTTRPSDERLAGLRLQVLPQTTAQQP
jgi:2-keto-4-pentenoate hydratase